VPHFFACQGYKPMASYVRWLAMVLATFEEAVMTRSEKIRETKRRRAEHEARMAALLAKARAIVATGVCPDCGSPLVHNNALPGWWQCAGYACDEFRKPEHKHLPSCHFQTFTER
jgi:hypothetical protein